jgi:hypothetical protein
MKGSRMIANDSFWFSCALALSVAAANAQAPPSDAHVVVRKAELTLVPAGACRAAPAELQVVINDVDTEPFRAVRQPSGVWLAEPTRLFDATRAQASVRFEDIRTDCERSGWRRDEKNRDVWLATFAFSCPVAGVHEITIRAPNVYVSYVRELSGKVPCRERGTFPNDNEPHSVVAVRFSQERLRLQIGEKKANINAPGLLVDDPAVIKDAKNGGHVAFDRERVVDALSKQRLRANASVSPGLSSNARKVDDATLLALGFKGVDLKVVK